MPVNAWIICSTSVFRSSAAPRLQEWIKDGRVLVNGATRRSRLIWLAGRCRRRRTCRRRLRCDASPEDIPLTILYEDADLVAIDKPAGMVVHAGAGVHSGTLVNALLHRFESLSRAGGDLRPGIVHRLDRYTSGVLLVAKNDAAHQRLAEQFAARKVEKTYLALVHGVVKQDRGRIEKPIARDPAQRVRMTARLAERPRGLERIPRAAALRRASRCSKCASAPAARTRSACTSPASATPSSATASTAPRPNRRPARAAALLPARAPHPVRSSRPPASPSTVESPLPAGACRMDELGSRRYN